MEDRIKFMHYSTVECYLKCPRQYAYRYRDQLEVIEDFEANNALKVGTALHRGMETDTETAINEYLMSYPVIGDEHITEAMKLAYWIPKVKAVVPEGIHERPMQNDWYQGTMDLLVPTSKHETKLKHGQYDLYDYKYSNNINTYMQSKQLHVYKWFYEKITGCSIRKMYFVFVPKVTIKQGKKESVTAYRRRILDAMAEQQVTIEEVIYNPEKVADFYDAVLEIGRKTTFEKTPSFLCRWCDYEKLCTGGTNYMILPKAERRQVGQSTKRKLWIYGAAFSGKTTFVDGAPMPLNLNTDGNTTFVTMPTAPIKDTYEGRIKVMAWEVFKRTIDELEKTAGKNGFQTIVVDLLEDTYESCRIYMYNKLGISHESDDSFRAWDKVRTEFLSTIRRLMNMDYENIVLISHEDTTKDITKLSGDKITAIKPNIAPKIANKIAGMVDIVARVVVSDDGTRTLNFKSNEVIFGGGRLKGIKTTEIPLSWGALTAVYDVATESPKCEADAKPEPEPQEPEEPEAEPEPEPEEAKPEAPKRRRRQRTEESEPEQEQETEPEAPKRRRRKRRDADMNVEIGENDLPF